jgi:hypothetical protein
LFNREKGTKKNGKELRRILSLLQTINHIISKRGLLGVITYVSMAVTHCDGADFLSPSPSFFGVDTGVADVGRPSSQLESTTIHQSFNCIVALLDLGWIVGKGE